MDMSGLVFQFLIELEPAYAPVTQDAMAIAEDKEGSAVMPAAPPVGMAAAAVVAAAASVAVVSWAMTLPTMARKRSESLILKDSNE
jgi:hypothetical protein